MKARTRAKPGAKPKPARARRKKKAPPKKKPGKSDGPCPSRKEAEEHFVRGVLIRGEAAKTRRGKLPPGATHEIVEEPAEENEEELPKIRRRRFSVV